MEGINTEFGAEYAVTKTHFGVPNMADIYFHHYLNSPFAEKVRRILAYKNLVWHSVLQPPIMPKPELVALTGGYRRIPVLQIGADVFCDTLLICDVLESIAPNPSIYPKDIDGVARTIASWMDGNLFSVAMAFNFGPKGAAAFFSKMPPAFATAFVEDRKAMRSGGARMNPTDATGAYKIALTRINEMVVTTSGGFLCGAVPSIADFAAYHPLWFTKNIPEIAGLLDEYPNISPWMAKVAALGQDNQQKSGLQASLNAAIAGSKAFYPEEAFVDEHCVALGSEVSIVAESFGPEVTTGRLISATKDRYTLERSHERCGTVRVHFPRLGFVLKEIK
jgi:glutathione S-transferase